MEEEKIIGAGQDTTPATENPVTPETVPATESETPAAHLTAEIPAETEPVEEKIFCTNCGAAISAEDTVCPVCGRWVKKADDIPEARETSAENTDGQEKAFCVNCGAELLPGRTFCTKCGHKVGDKLPVTPPLQPLTGEDKKSKSKLGPVLSVILGIALVFFGVNEIGKANLRSNLRGEWYKYDDPLVLALDINEDTIEYGAQGSYIGYTTLAYLDWRPVSGSKIVVSYSFWDNDRTIEVEFNDDKDVVTFSPNIVTGDSYAVWVKLD